MISRHGAHATHLVDRRPGQQPGHRQRQPPALAPASRSEALQAAHPAQAHRHGRKTWESLPGLLPQRTHIVISRNPDYRAPGCTLTPSPEAAIRAAGAVPEIMVVGGAAIYRHMLPLADRMYLTLVHQSVAGDARFPQWDPAQWRETGREDFPADDKNPYSFSFVTLERRRDGGRL